MEDNILERVLKGKRKKLESLNERFATKFDDNYDEDDKKTELIEIIQEARQEMNTYFIKEINKSTDYPLPLNKYLKENYFDIYDINGVNFRNSFNNIKYPKKIFPCYELYSDYLKNRKGDYENKDLSDEFFQSDLASSLNEYDFKKRFIDLYATFLAYEEIKFQLEKQLENLGNTKVNYSKIQIEFKNFKKADFFYEYEREKSLKNKRSFYFLNSQLTDFLNLLDGKEIKEKIEVYMRKDCQYSFFSLLGILKSNKNLSLISNKKHPTQSELLDWIFNNFIFFKMNTKSELKITKESVLKNISHSKNLYQKKEDGKLSLKRANKLVPFEEYLTTY